jgi:regulator of replication initiation timing
MIEKLTERGISPIELMRVVSSNFDDNLAIGTDSHDNSMSIPMTTLGEKARLINGIQDIFISSAWSSSDILEQENMQLRNENRMLKDVIGKIEERLATIEASLPNEKVIIMREISKEAAEKEIRQLFSEGKALYYSDIAEHLRLDLQLVVEICNELQKRGEIKIDGNA